VAPQNVNATAKATQIISFFINRLLRASVHLKFASHLIGEDSRDPFNVVFGFPALGELVATQMGSHIDFGLCLTGGQGHACRDRAMRGMSEQTLGASKCPRPA
jgi:hypothetical protein